MPLAPWLEEELMPWLQEGLNHAQAVYLTVLFKSFQDEIIRTYWQRSRICFEAVFLSLQVFDNDGLLHGLQRGHPVRLV